MLYSLLCHSTLSQNSATGVSLSSLRYMLLFLSGTEKADQIKFVIETSHPHFFTLIFLTLEVIFYRKIDKFVYFGYEQCTD